MADNKTVDNGSLTDIPVATDEVSYSGDTVDIPLIRPVHVTGSEGSKTVVELTSADGVKTTIADRTTSGTMDAANEEVELDLNGLGQPICVLSGTLANGATSLVFYYDPGTGVNGSLTGWKVMQCLHLNNTAPIVLRYVISATSALGNFSDGIYKPLGSTGMKRVKVVMTARGGADSVTATWYAGAAQADVVYSAVCGDIADDGSDDNLTTINSPPVKIGGRAIVGWAPPRGHGERVNAFFDYYGRQLQFIDQRVGATIEKYQIALTIVGVTGAGTNVFGLRKQNANPNARITKISAISFNSGAVTAVSPLRFFRGTTVAGGSAITAADIPKRSTGAGNATLEVRTGAVTGTKANQPFLVLGAPGTLTTGQSGYMDRWEAGLDFSERIILTGDEGIICEQLVAGDVDQRWYVTVEWEEDA